MRGGIEPSATPFAFCLFSPPPCYSSTCCGFVCGFGGDLRLSAKKKSQHWPHTKQTYAHLRWHQNGNHETMSALLVWMEMPLEQDSDHSGTLKISPQVILVKYSVLWLQTGRGEFHCRFYRLQSKILPQHSGNISTQTSDREIIKTRCSTIRGILIQS